MPKRDDTLLLQDMIDACEDIFTFLKGCSEAAFMADRLKQYAVIKALEIVGEAATKVSPSLRGVHGEIPWKNIIGMRNILIHVYHEADLDLVWRTSQQFVPLLQQQLRAILKSKVR